MAKIHSQKHISKEQETQDSCCYPQQQRTEHTEKESPLPKGILDALQAYC